jgi:hypothetical protein
MPALRGRTSVRYGTRLWFAVGLDQAFNRLYYESLSYQRDPLRNGTRVPERGRTRLVSVSYHLSRP